MNADGVRWVIVAAVTDPLAYADWAESVGEHDEAAKVRGGFKPADVLIWHDGADEVAILLTQLPKVPGMEWRAEAHRETPS